jgi:hypothetical protein
VFWLVRFAFKLVSRLTLIAMAGAAGFATGLFLQARSEQQSWGVVATDTRRDLPGDDLVPVPDIVETRTLRIDAPPEAVWPWLVQMGWGRGGWYSYDRMDMDRPSADEILEEFQELAEGDLVPTHPEGGFVARVVDPGRALALYLDSGQLQAQAEAAQEALTDDEGAAEDTPPGLQVAGVMGDLAMPEFRASWAFVLEPAPGDGARLIERFRVWTGQDGPAQQVGMPLFGLGVFLMTRKHMLGVKERAERHAS